MKFKVFDIDVDYSHRPNDDIYEATVPKEITIEVEVPADFNDWLFSEQKEWLKDEVIETLEDCIEFDTPDDPDFGISDVSFCFETAD
jgi:hypothetical protein